MKAVVTIIAALVAFASAWALDIHSTLEGGLWTNSTTWQGGTVPGQADNVFLHGPVAVNDTLNCHNITIFSGARLYPYGGNSSLNVGGSLVNNGTVDNPTLFCAGNITSSSRFVPYRLAMSGSGNQYISTSGTFEPLNFTKTSDLGTVTPLNDLNLVGCQINFNGGTLNLSGGRQLSLNGGSIIGISILGTGGGSLNLTGNVKLWDTTADEIILQGGCYIGSGVSIGILHNYAVLRPDNELNPSILRVTGRLNNYGSLNDTSSAILKLDLAGDLYNYNYLNNNTINFCGNQTQIFWQSDDSPEMTCWNFTAQANAAPIQLMSNLRFYGCTVNLGGRTLRLFTPTASHTLSLRGAQLKNAVIQGNSTSTLNFVDYCKLSSLAVDEARFTGNARCCSGVVVGIMHNYAVLQPDSGSNPSILRVTGRLNNYGSLNDTSSAILKLDLAGDLYNYNNLNNNTINLSGDRTQILWQSDDSPDINSSFLSAAYSTHPVEARSKLRFYYCTVDFSGRSLDLCPGNTGRELKMVGSSLQNIVLTGGNGATLNFQNECYLLNVTGDEIVTRGCVVIHSNVSFSTLINHGTVQSHRTVYPAILTVTGKLENWGTIKNNPPYHSALHLHLQGNLHNHGSLNNQRTYVNGNADQYLNMYPGCSVTCEGGFVLVSEIGAGQWYFNGAAQLPDNTEQYNANPFVQGVWQLYNGSAWSRHIYIDEGLNAPLNLILTVSPANALTLQWDQVPNATAYKVYYATAPGGPWSAFTGSVIDDDTGDGIVTYPVGQSQHHMFYRVTSLK